MKKWFQHINISTWKIIVLVVLPILSTLMHLQVFSMDLIGPHVWRQSQTMTNVVNFYEGDFNILNPQRNNQGTKNGIYRMEFPIMQWCFAAVTKVTGQPLLVSRILTFVISLISILGFYFLLKSLFNNEIIALIGAWALNFSPAFYYYAVSPLPDNFALCAGIWALAVFLKSLPEPNWKNTILSAFLMSLSMAAKMPFILFYAIPFGFYIQKIIQRKLVIQDVFKGLIWIGFFVPTLLWYLWVIPTWEGNGIVAGILVLADSPTVLLDYLQHNLFSNLPELFLNIGAVPLFIAGFYFIKKRKTHQHHLFYPLLFWAFLTLLYFFFELNMIAKVHDYYLFPFYPMLFMIVAYGAFYLSNIKNGKTIVTVLLISLPILAFARIQGRWNIEKPRFNKDLLKHKTELQELSQKSDLIIVGNDASYSIWFYHLDRKGWVFATDRLKPNELKFMVENGAKYLYTDSKTVLNNPKFKPYLQNEVGKFGTIYVYKLK
ncbi:MAG: ArnT family glycosyltransferase [Saprospiraceae bacterium]